MITLTDEERQKFADWLDQEVTSDRKLVEMLEKMSPELARVRKIEIAAKAIVTKVLRSIETQIIGTSPTPAGAASE